MTTAQGEGWEVELGLCKDTLPVSPPGSQAGQTHITQMAVAPQGRAGAPQGRGASVSLGHCD